MLVDTHAHLDQPEFDADRDAVIARAIDAGVGRIVVVGLDVVSSRRSIELAEKYPEVYATVGLHPSSAGQYADGVIEELRSLARHPKVVAIGEVGLDFYRKRAPREIQERAFRKQLSLAAELGLPVVIHDREAHDAVLDIVGEWISGEGLPLALKGVMHCFSGDVALAWKVVEMGFLISIAGPVTYPNAGGIVQVVEDISLSSIMVETDCPFLAPQLFRGKRNEPAYVCSNAERIAQIKACSLKRVEIETTENARRLFGLGLEKAMTPGEAAT